MEQATAVTPLRLGRAASRHRIAANRLRFSARNDFVHDGAAAAIRSHHHMLFDHGVVVHRSGLSRRRSGRGFLGGRRRRGLRFVGGRRCRVIAVCLRSLFHLLILGGFRIGFLLGRFRFGLFRGRFLFGGFLLSFRLGLHCRFFLGFFRGGFISRSFFGRSFVSGSFVSGSFVSGSFFGRGFVSCGLLCRSFSRFGRFLSGLFGGGSLARRCGFVLCGGKLVLEARGGDKAERQQSKREGLGTSHYESLLKKIKGVKGVKGHGRRQRERPFIAWRPDNVDGRRSGQIPQMAFQNSCGERTKRLFSVGIGARGRAAVPENPRRRLIPQRLDHTGWEEGG